MKQELKDTHIYFPAKTLAGLKKMAAANHRTMSAEIVMAVEARLQEWRMARAAVKKRNVKDWPNLCPHCDVAITDTDYAAGRCTNCNQPLIRAN